MKTNEHRGLRLGTAKVLGKNIGLANETMTYQERFPYKHKNKANSIFSWHSVVSSAARACHR